jgi:glycosyltransferase involved in cell wall biosynthesis
MKGIFETARASAASGNLTEALEQLECAASENPALRPIIAGYMSVLSRRTPRERFGVLSPAGPKKIITACICTYNRYDYLPEAIASLQRQTLNRDLFDVIVVDNSPPSDSQKAFRSRYKAEGINYVIEMTPGLSNARNVGLRLSRSKYIAYLDDDAVACVDWLTAIVDCFEVEGDRAAVIGGPVSPIWETARPDWLSDRLANYVTALDWGSSRRELTIKEWCVGANIAYRTEDLRNIGGFDVSLGRNGATQSLLSNEETAVSNRLRKTGKSVFYEPRARVDHLVPHSRLNQSWFRKRVAWQAISDYVAYGLRNSDVERYLEYARAYFSSVPPPLRNINGLLSPCGTMTEFEKQLDAIYNVTTVLLDGHELK